MTAANVGTVGAYVAVTAEGMVQEVVVDDPKRPEDTMEALCEFVRDGLRIERVTLEQARLMLYEPFKRPIDAYAVKLEERLKWTRDRWQDVMEDVALYAQQVLGKPIAEVGGLVGGFHAVASNEFFACDGALKGEGYYAKPTNTDLTLGAVLTEDQVRARSPHVAWLRFNIGNDGRPTTIHLCNSDSPGAFKVYRHPTNPENQMNSHIPFVTFTVTSPAFVEARERLYKPSAGWDEEIEKERDFFEAGYNAGRQSCHEICRDQQQRDWALRQGDVLADWCNRSGNALKAMMGAYERRIRSLCSTPEQIEAQVWRCAEFIQAERTLADKPVAVVEIGECHSQCRDSEGKS